MSSLAQRRQAARDAARQAARQEARDADASTPTAKKSTPTKVDDLAAIALATQSLPVTWVPLLSEVEKKQLAKSLNDGLATKATVKLAERIREKQLASRKATVAADVDLADTTVPQGK